MDSVARPAAKLPTVKLDTTLSELYQRASPKNAGERLAQVLCGVSSGLALSSSFPRNTKFLFQDHPFNTRPQRELDSTNGALQRSLAMKYLALMAQRDSFVSGAGPVVLFNVGETPDQIEHDRKEAETTLAVIDPSQRPELVFCPGPSEIPIKEYRIDRIAYKLALDGLDAYPLTVPLETHWILNSKAALARSGLPTPRADIIEVVGDADPPGACCLTCQSDDRRESPFIATTCTGSRGKWISAQIQRVTEAVRARAVPFVLKNQQTFGGAGTWVVTTDEEKQELLRELAHDDGVLRKILSQVTADNAHLGPGTVIITEAVTSPIGNYGLTFFTMEGGGPPIYLAVSEQVMGGSNAWLGSTIDYSRQDMLRKKFKGIMDETAAWLALYGYYGPVGVDVLETRTAGETETVTGEKTAYQIVDLNVRTSGSICLPLLSAHFTDRGLNCASSFSITVKRTRAEFVERWRDEFESGKFCILSWYEDHKSGESIADVAVGAEDEECLRTEMRKVRDEAEDVTF